MLSGGRSRRRHIAENIVLVLIVCAFASVALALILGVIVGLLFL